MNNLELHNALLHIATEVSRIKAEHPIPSAIDEIVNQVSGLSGTGSPSRPVGPSPSSKSWPSSLLRSSS